jgi:hypothetical protein
MPSSLATTWKRSGRFAPDARWTPTCSSSTNRC